MLEFLSGAALINLTLAGPNGDVIGGWALEPVQLRIGFTRLMYPFFAGFLLSRIAKLTYVKNIFLWYTLLIVIVLAIPKIGGSEHLWANGLYDSLSTIFIFPLIVFLGASGEMKGKYVKIICIFFGEISYPICITHYPLIYIYTGCVYNNKVPFGEVWPFGLFTLIASILLAYVCLKLYDEPVRKWLNKKMLPKDK